MSATGAAPRATLDLRVRVWGMGANNQPFHQNATAQNVSITGACISGIEQELSAQVVRFIQAVRQLDLAKLPGVAETLDFANAVVSLRNHRLDAEVIEETMGCVAKSMEDGAKLREAGIDKLLQQIS